MSHTHLTRTRTAAQKLIELRVDTSLHARISGRVVLPLLLRDVLRVGE